MPEVIAEVEKNSREVIRIQREVYRGIPLLDLRVWVPAGGYGEELQPTRKGLALRPETWLELLPELQAALADAEEQEAEE